MPLNNSFGEGGKDYDFSKWGVINIYGEGKKVKILGSAQKGAGRIEARIYVLYEE